MLFTEHGRHFPDFPRRKRILINRLLLRRSDKVVAVGKAVRQALVANEGIRPGRISVIYNGIEAGAFSCNAGGREAVRRELQIDAGSLVLVQVARLDYLKDHATAIRTIQHVVAHRPETLLLLIGEGPELAKIEDQVRQSNLVKHIRFLGLRQDVPRLLAAADLCLLTSISEGIPLTLIEAMCACLPVVATEVGGVGEVVEDGKTGFLARAQDHRALAQLVVRLAEAPALRRHLGLQGRQRAEAVFSQQQMHGAYNRLYQEMLGAPLARV
jgi:glycosyltransferase involved in cell wall biosynthesis